MEKRFLTPVETAQKIAENGTRVMTQSLSRTLALSLLAGFYVAFGAQLSTVVAQDTAATLGMGLSRFISGSVFSLGLILVAICGAELFTGNTLLTKAALHGQIGSCFTLGLKTPPSSGDSSQNSYLLSHA